MVAQTTTEAEEAKRVADSMEPLDSEITHEKSNDGRHVFDYTSHVHAHLLEDGWEFRGFGSRWFAIARE